MSQPNRIIIHIGQSNAVGRVDITSLPSGRQGLKYNLRVFNGTGFECIDSTQNNNQYGQPSNQYGYEFDFLDFADSRGNDVYLLKYAVGGSCLANVSTHTSGTWNVNQSQHYADLLTHIQTVKDWMDERGKDYEFVGVIWHQGESDCSTLAYANAYETNESDLIDGVNTALGVDPYWYIVDIHGSLNRTYDSNVMAAKAANVAADTSKRRLINQDDCTLLGDNIHLAAAGNVTLGQRLITNILTDIS